jgi:hypothetical protein
MPSASVVAITRCVLTQFSFSVSVAKTGRGMCARLVAEKRLDYDFTAPCVARRGAELQAKSQATQLHAWLVSVKV